MICVLKGGARAQVISGVQTGLLAGLMVIICGIWANMASAQGQGDDIRFAAYTGLGGEIVVRVDHIPPDAAPLFRIEVDVGGDTATLPRPYVDPQKSYQLKGLRPTSNRLRLRPVYIRAGAESPGPWGAWQRITPAGSGRSLPQAPADRGWQVVADPQTSNAIAVTIDTPPRAGGQVIYGYRLRVGIRDAGVVLPPEPGQSITVPLNLATVPLGRPQLVYLAAVSSAGRGPWSKAKTVATAWRDTPHPPEAFGPASWLIRPGAFDDGAVLEIDALPYDYEAGGLRIDWRRAPATDLLDPAPQWSDWQPLENGTKTGARVLRGFDPGQRFQVQIRLVSDLGPGQASVPKLVTARALPAPTTAVIGALNPAGTGRIRIPKEAQLRSVSAGSLHDWFVSTGPGGWDYLLSRRAARELPDMVMLDFSDAHQLRVTRAEATFAVETPEDLARALALGARRLSGARLLIGAEWLDTTADQNLFSTPITGLSDPLTIAPREPALGTLISRWVLVTRRASQVVGQIRFEDLDFYLPEAIAVRNGPVRQVNVLDMVRGAGVTRNVEIDGVTIRSDVVPARMGYSSDVLLRGIDLTGAEDTRVQNSTLSFLTYGLATGGTRSVIRDNSLHHIIGDPVNIYFRRGTSDDPTRLADITIENNTQSDYIGDGYGIHGDALHMWMIGAGRAPDSVDISGLRYRGNVSFPGAEGIAAPPVVSPGFKATPVSGDQMINAAGDGRFYRVSASAQGAVVQLPKANETFSLREGPAKGASFVVQKVDFGPGPVRIRAASGDLLDGQNGQDLVLRAPWEAVVLVANPGRTGSGPSGWTVRGSAPAYQGFYADENDVPLRDSVIEGNILWGMAPNQIMPRNRPQAGVYVHHNTLLTPFPGDRNGDGRYNSRGDGTNLVSLRIVLGAWDDQVNVWSNLATHVDDSRHGPEVTPPVIWNNGRLSWADPAGLHAAFPASRLADPSRPDSLIWMPTTRDEAIALARPAAQSDIARAGQGALGPDAASDWWDFTAGARAPGAIDALQLLDQRPAPGSTTVPRDSSALIMTFSAPIPAQPGRVTLIRRDTGNEVQSWSLEALDDVRLRGPQVILPLSGRLRVGTSYELRLPPEGVQDIFGQRFAGLSSPWRFTPAADAAVNLLHSADPRADWWKSPGWQALSPPQDPSVYQSAGPDIRPSLRIDSRNDANVLRRGKQTLSFDYGPLSNTKGMTSTIRLFDEAGDTVSVPVSWDKIANRPGIKVGPKMFARRRDVSAEYGMRAGSMIRAELTWTNPQGLDRLLIDLVRGFPPEGKITRLMLNAGAASPIWTPP